MKRALISDIHGNLEALTAVLATFSHNKSVKFTAWGTSSAMGLIHASAWIWS